MTTNLSAALDYAGRGLRVLPIMPGGKRPPMRAWQDAATTDPETIRLWWTGLYADHGVGIATGAGSGVFVLDVDVADGKAGDETLRDLTDTYGELPETPSVITGSGGAHYYYRLPEGAEIRNDAGKRLGAGLDIRGEGGQVVAPPTIHPTTARAYEWEHGAGLDEIEIAEAPGWLLALLTAEPDITPAVMVSASSGEDGPAQRYNDATTWAELLTRDGWTLGHRDTDGTEHWTRPGKETREGTSATVGYQGRDILRVFTSAVPGLDEQAYSRFGYTAAMHHGGDRSAFAAELKRAEMAPVDRWLDSVPTAEAARPTVMHDTPPLPLGSPHRYGPTFPMHCLPAWVAEQCAEVAHAFQVPVDLPAMLAIGALSTIATGRVRVNLTGSAWSEHVNLYLVSAMAPGTGKSPVYKVMMRPVGEIETESMRQAKAAIRDAQARRQIAERKLAAASKDDSHEAARNIAAVLAELDELPTPPAGRLVVEDITPEALVEELAANAGRLAIMSSEGGVFDMMGGQYSERGKATNLSIYLQGWSGDSVRRKRTKGEESRIDEALLTVCVTTQPGVVASLGANKELTTKGVPVRFMFSVPPSLVGYRDRSRVFTTMSPEVAETYTETLLRIGRRLLANQHPTTLQLTGEAAAEFVAWDQAIEERQRPGADLAERAEWAAKLRASVLRMAGLLHVADNAAAGERETFGEIGLGTITRAIEIGGYWLAHADVVEKMWTDDQVNAKARTIVRWAIEHGPEFTLRDLFVAKRGSFPTADEAVAPMQMLVDRGWISPLQDGPVMVGGRGVPSQRFELRADAAEHLNAADAKSAAQPAQPAQLIHSEDVDRVESDPACGKVARVEMVARKSGNKNYLPITPQQSTPEPPAQPAQPAQLPPADLDPTGTDPTPFRPF